MIGAAVRLRHLQDVLLKCFSPMFSCSPDVGDVKPPNSLYVRLLGECDQNQVQILRTPLDN